MSNLLEQVLIFGRALACPNRSTKQVIGLVA